MGTASLLASRKHVLLDFDGPVCAVYGRIPDRVVADRLKEVLLGELPRDVEAYTDPFDVLRYSATIGSETAAVIEYQFRALEVGAVLLAPETPGAVDAIRYLVAAGHTVTIVSNNAAEAVRKYLDAQGLSDQVRGVSARESADPGLLKPSPYLLDRAMESLETPPEQCVMIGDSVSDIEAARQARTAVIAYADKPGKRERFEPYEPDAIIDGMAELVGTGAVSR